MRLLPFSVAFAPTPMAGLALGIGSLGWAWENMGAFGGAAQLAGASIAGLLLVVLAAKFLLHPGLLAQDLAHPVVGSVVPTFAMALMVVSKVLPGAWAMVLWLVAVVLHAGFLAIFLRHRLRSFALCDMVPSWFVPPVGIIVAAVASPGGILALLAHLLLWFGLVCYGILLPVMLYRLIFAEQIPEAARPTLAILAAPASLSLTGYLSLVDTPSSLLVGILLGLSLLMTIVIYLAFFSLLRLPFSPGYAAFTFPMVIGATALFKVSHLFGQWGFDAGVVAQLHFLAVLELIIATIMVVYVTACFGWYFIRGRQAVVPA